MHSTHNSNTVKLDKWDDNADAAVTATVLVVASASDDVAVVLVVVVELEVVIVARRNGHIMQIDLVYNAGRTSSNIWHDEKNNTILKWEQNTKIIN